MKEPIKHHYIPQFILREFCDEEGKITYYDLEEQKLIEKKPENIFMKRNLYRDIINNPEDPTKLEKDLAKFENEASTIIKKFLVENAEEVTLSFEEDEKLKIFFAIMSFRSESVKESFREPSSEEFKNLYVPFQEDGDLIDLWKRNLGEIVNCRSVSEIRNNPRIDEPIKIFMMRDTIGLTGLYFIPVERRGNEEFLISDCYPAVIRGATSDGRHRVNLYYVYPISAKRALFLAANGVSSAPFSATGFTKDFFRKPSVSHDRKNITFRLKKIYEPDVRKLNEAMYENSVSGIACRDPQKVHIYKEILNGILDSLGNREPE